MYPGKLALVALSRPRHPRQDGPQRAASSRYCGLLPSFPIAQKNALRQSPRPRPCQCFVLAPSEPGMSPRHSPDLLQTNLWRSFRKFRDAYRPSGRGGPCPGNTETPLASPVMAPQPNPSDPVFLSLEALRPRPSRALLAEMAAIKVARLLHHRLVEPIAGRSQL